MALAAVLAVFVGVLVGVLLLAEVANAKGLGWFKAAHLLLAVAAVAVISAAALTASSAVAWLAAGVVLATASAGVLLWRRSVAGASPDVPGVPTALLAIHGTAAALALLLIVLAAIL